MLRVSSEVRAEVLRFAGEQQAEKGRHISANDAVAMLLESYKQCQHVEHAGDATPRAQRRQRQTTREGMGAMRERRTARSDSH